MRSEEKLLFTDNWNNKLNCSSFSTIRIWSSQKYVIGRVYDIFLLDKSGETQIKGKNYIYLGQAELGASVKILYPYINEVHAQLDTGRNLDWLRTLLKSFYRPYLDKHKSQARFGFYVFKWINRIHHVPFKETIPEATGKVASIH